VARRVFWMQIFVAATFEFAGDGGNRYWSSRWGWKQRLLLLWWWRLGEGLHVSLELLYLSMQT